MLFPAGSILKTIQNKKIEKRKKSEKNRKSEACACSAKYILVPDRPSADKAGQHKRCDSDVKGNLRSKGDCCAL